MWWKPAIGASLRYIDGVTVNCNLKLLTGRAYFNHISTSMVTRCGQYSSFMHFPLVFGRARTQHIGCGDMWGEWEWLALVIPCLGWQALWKKGPQACWCYVDVLKYHCVTLTGRYRILMNSYNPSLLYIYILWTCMFHCHYGIYLVSSMSTAWHFPWTRYLF